MMCFLQALLGYLVLFLAHELVGLFLRWLRVQSQIKGTRSVREMGVRVWIGGPFERLLAFVLVVFLRIEKAFPSFWLGSQPNLQRAGTVFP